MTIDREHLVALLREVVDVWHGARVEGSSHASILDGLSAPDFDKVDLLNEVQGLQGIEEVLQTGRLVQIRFYDSVGYAHRAEFVAMPSKEWKLRSLKFQCPVCFGAGVNDGKVCLGCGGAGWGAAAASSLADT